MKEKTREEKRGVGDHLEYAASTDSNKLPAIARLLNAATDGQNLILRV